MVIRGYLTGHAWREIAPEKRSLCGIALPKEWLKIRNLPSQLLLPRPKREGHDEDISREEIIAQGL
jgi:phosphoribosylaminoimidazole-succinocarboxamide synthase